MSAGDRGPRWGKRLGLTLVSLAVSLAGAEFVYRWATAPDPNAPDGFDYEWRERYIRMNETLYRASEDEALVYEPTPSSAVEMEYGTANFNAQAMREQHDVALAPGADVRVAVVGDSLVWSEFVAVEDALPQQLDAALGPGWEALNFGVSGYDTASEARWYERHVRRFGADVVVVVYCMNDMMIMSGPFERFADDDARARKDAQEALLAQVAPIRRETIDDVVFEREKHATFKLWARFTGILTRREFDANYDDEYLVMARQASAARAFETALSRLGEAIRRDGALPVFVISPVLESWTEYHWSELHAQVRAAAEGAGFAVLDPLAEWRAAGQDVESMRVPGDNLHYDPSGNEAFARSIAAFLEERGEAPRARARARVAESEAGSEAGSGSESRSEAGSESESESDTGSGAGAP